MTGSLYDHDRLIEAFETHERAEREFDAEPTRERALIADLAHHALVVAAVACDRSCLRQLSLHGWIVNRIATYRAYIAHEQRVPK